MTHIPEDLFNFSGFPTGIYQTLFNEDRLVASTHDANGAVYIRNFPPFYSSASSAAIAVASAYPEIFRAFPRTHAILKGYAGSPAHITQTAVNSRSAAIMHSTQLINYPREEITNPSIPANSLPAEHRIHPTVRLISSNLSQLHRNRQEAFVRNQCSNVQRLLSHLTRWCEDHKAIFSLRPLIAMPSPRQADLRRVSPLAGIPIPSLYYTHAQTETLALLNQLSFSDLIWPVTESLGNPALDCHAEWAFWDDRSAYAMIRFMDTKHELALMPSPMIPPLYREIRNELPIFVLPSMTTWLPGDVGNMVMNMTPDELSYGQAYGSQLTYNYQLLADTMSIFTCYASMVASTLRLGRGNHKPTWTSATLNAFICEAFEYLICHTLQRWENGDA